MSENTDEKELRRIEAFKMRGVETWDDLKQEREIRRRMAKREFEREEEARR